MINSAGITKKTFCFAAIVLVSLLAQATIFGQVKWTCANKSPAFAERAYHSSIAFDGKMWVLHGMNASSKLGDIWHSTTGTDWIQATNSVPYPMRTLAGVVVFNGYVWILCGGESC